MEISRIIEEKVGYFDAIVFFGSASRGEDSENSDFDIFVFGAKEVDIDFGRMEKNIHRKINIMFGVVKDLKKSSKEMLNNLINGFVLKGYLKVLE